MARLGLWQEALFRFQQAEKLEPENPRIQSNLAVAYEASGEFDKALAAYQSALRIAPNDKDIRANYSRFVEFYQGFKGEAKAGETKPSTPEDTPPPPTDNRPPG
jgi:tetratricopeptide (TPR) repeat protein